MTLYATLWLIAFAVWVVVFAAALRARVAFIPVGKFAWWAVAYPVIVGGLGLMMVSSYRERLLLPVDFAMPATVALLGVATLLAVLAYGRKTRG